MTANKLIAASNKKAFRENERNINNPSKRRFLPAISDSNVSMVIYHKISTTYENARNKHLHAAGF